jgi:hypothetical protein
MEHPWLVDAEQRIRRDPSAVHTLFPAAGRMVGRRCVHESDPDGFVHGTVEDHARVVLLAVLAEVVPPSRLAFEVGELYRYGDRAERRGVLRGLPVLPDPCLALGLSLVADALRTNDSHLIAAALGPFAAAHLDLHQWRHGVLKCLFVGVPVAAVADLRRRGDAELARMVADYAAERRAAGRDVGADALTLLEKGGVR